MICFGFRSTCGKIVDFIAILRLSLVEGSNMRSAWLGQVDLWEWGIFANFALDLMGGWIWLNLEI